MIVPGRVGIPLETHTEFTTAKSFYPKSKPDRLLTANFRESTFTLSGWWFQTFFMFIPTRNDPI